MRQLELLLILVIVGFVDETILHEEFGVALFTIVEHDLFARSNLLCSV